jgi:transposase
MRCGYAVFAIGGHCGMASLGATNKTILSTEHRWQNIGMARRKEIPAALWKRIEPLIPQVEPSPKSGWPRVSDQQALNGIVYVQCTGIPWEELPQGLGYGSGMTCWRRLRAWQIAGVWHRLHQVLLAELRRADKLT